MKINHDRERQARLSGMNDSEVGDDYKDGKLIFFHL